MNAQKGPGNVTFEYGFRYDPMEFVENSDSLQAALVRRHVFHKPKPGDEGLLKQRIEQILAEQREDGTLGEPGHERAARLMELADCGADPEEPRVKRAIEAALRGDPEKDGEAWVRDIRALCLFGKADDANVKRSLRAILDREEEWNGPHKLCPWGQAFYLRGLWPARQIVDTTECCRRALRWMLEGLNEAGCVTYKDPWGLIWAAGIIDLPEAKRLVELELPNILRGQEPDGGWGSGQYDQWSKNSLKVFQALVNHGVFDALRNLPPLPPDWKVVREIPAPEGDLWTMTWDSENLWVMDRTADEAIAVSPEDGAVRKRVKIPFEKPQGIGWWDGGLGVAQREPKRVVKLEPDTGEVVRGVPVDRPDWCEVSGVAQVNGQLWVNDDFNGVIRRVDPDSGPEPTLHGSAGSLPCSLTPAPGGVWEIDAFAPSIIKSDYEGKLIEWGEKPFGGRCDGLAWDGENLWALDDAGKRICAIERASGEEGARMAASGADPKHEEVLLEDVLADWKRITGDLKEHQAVVGDVVYVQPCVYLTTHLVEMWAAGWKEMDFDTVAAVSGCSALFGYQPGTFLPKYAHVWIDMHDRIAKATGFGYEWVKIDGADRAWDIVKESIDAGKPVKGWHYENLLFGGYQDAAEKSDRKVFVMADGPDTIAEWWTWEQFEEWVKDWSHGQVGRHTERIEAAPQKETALCVMTDLVEWSHTHPERVRQEYPEAKFGLEGIEAYASDCADTETYEDWSACHPINPQWTIRNSTGVYLERVAEAGLFPKDATAHIATAARHYRAAFSDWQEFYDLLGHHAPEGAGKVKERREAGAAVARRWLEHEKAAIAKLRQALALLEE